jgi:hypothetical protein
MEEVVKNERGVGSTVLGQAAPCFIKNGCKLQEGRAPRKALSIASHLLIYTTSS